MRRAFSLLESLAAVALTGAIALFSMTYINTKYVSQESIKLELQAHINLITSTILQCKEYSQIMPVQSDGSLASDTLLDSLECNTTTPYPLDGGKGSFIPSALSQFTPYKATQNGDEFYFSTSTKVDSYQYEALQELNSTYSTQQYELDVNSTDASLKFYLSR